MKLKFDRRKIESFCIVLSFALVLFITFLGILAITDETLGWDILPENMEKIMILIMSSVGMVLGATFLISIMTNFSIISLSMERIADKIEIKDDKGNSN